ncbi:MAG TPA: amidohydrolase family protein [Candidatus Limnocylindrales bacterium]|nr:amidohydrolase family protein [Candidatus Limnocylindrales bacterium]
MADRLLIQGGIVLTMDPQLGEQPGADVLVEGDRIVDVGRGLSVADAQVIDARGDIVIPGFVDTHRHTWETSIRTCAPDYTLSDYFTGILDQFAPKYRPDDVYAANLWGALECLNAGITTLVDWSHIMNTPEHADAAIKGLQESGIRAVFAYGFPNTSLADWWFNSALTTPAEDARRVRRQYFSSDQGLITMALATRGPGFCRPEVVRADWELARELGVYVTVHVAMDRLAGKFLMVKQLHDMGLLYPKTTYIHCSHLTDEEWGYIRDSGGDVSFAPQVELQMGHGWAPAVKALEYGLPIGLSSDVCTTAPADQFTQMRAIFGSERARRHEISWEQDVDPTQLITSRQVLEWATLGGARVAGVADRTGSITPGKKADLVILDGSAVNVAPIIDPVGAVVCAADVSNVETVIVDGRIVKRDGKLVADLAGPRRLVEESRDYLVSQVQPQPGWLAAARVTA